MLLVIIGFVFIVVFTIQVYKTASGNRRNGGGWATATALVGIAIQFGMPMFVGVVYGLYLAANGRGRAGLNQPVFGLFALIELLGIVFSVVGMWFIMRHVSKLPEDDDSTPQPPPPPRFGDA